MSAYTYKDSRIEWIGEIPGHWGILKLKYILKIKSGDGILSENILPDGKFEIYGGNGFIGYSNDFNVDNFTLVIGRVGAKCGNVYLIENKKWITDNALITKTNNNYTFLYYLLLSLDLNKLANHNAQPLITSTMIKTCSIALPPLPEQKAIAEYLDKKTNQTDTLITKIQTQITTLQEYRTALISAATTGKIDVRDFAKQEQN